jgi:predicted amidophosphoribosyltransferase
MLQLVVPVVTMSFISIMRKHLCIIDDAMTTGNTVNEVAKCLKEAGVEWSGVEWRGLRFGI